MRRRSIVFALIVLWSCAGGSADDARRTFDSARLALHKGQLSDAKQLAERGAARASSAPDWAEQFRLLTTEILIVQGDLSAARAALDAPPIAGTSAPELRARRHFLEARLHQSEGNLSAALESLRQARAISDQPQDTLLAIEWLQGQTQLRLGKWSEGQATLESAAKDAIRASNRHQAALALNDIGMGHLVRGRYDEALSWFERVLSYSDLQEMTVHAAALSNAGICYSRLGQFERALAAQNRAVEFYRRGPPLQYVQALGSLGITHGLNGDFRAALPFLQKAFDEAVKANLQGHAALWAGNLATVHAKLGSWDEADRLNNEAQRLGADERTVKRVYYTLNAADIAAGRGRPHEAQRLFEEALGQADGTAAVIWSAHAGLARAAMASGDPARASRHFEAALATIEKTRSNLLRTEFKLSFLTQLIEFYQSYVDALISQNRIDRALEIVESSRGRVLAERHGVQSTSRPDVRALRRAARESNLVFLSYWLAPHESSLWVVTGDSIRRLPLPPAEQIEVLVEQHQAIIHNTFANALAEGTPGDRLYQLLVAPAARWIPSGTSVVIVPDGALHRLNFETLPVKGQRLHYWIEDVVVQIAPSLTTLTEKRPSTPVDGSLLLIGDAMARPPEFPALRYASTEMSNLARHFPSGDVVSYRGEKAVPAAYRDASLERFAMIHFTAHAVANAESPLDSAIMLSGPEDGYKLYARDVAERPMNARLVTVSACRSAGERAYSGEGLVGFAWAFMRAGAHRVIAGLWDVDDRSTAQLMDRVYSGIAAGTPPALALRDAKLAQLREGGSAAKPYYWAPFELFTATTAN